MAETRLLLLYVLVFLFNPICCYAKVQTSRQAIPVAIVQGGTLSNSGPSNEKKIENEPQICNTTYQNCADSLINQAKLDKKLRQEDSPINITESAYNASVAGALEANKETISHNKTIHLIQNNTNANDKLAAKPIHNVPLIANGTLPQIVIQPYNASFDNKPTETLLKINQTNKNNIVNKTISLNNTMSQLTKLQQNTSSTETENNTLNATTDKRARLLLPSHVTNIYLHRLVDKTKPISEKDKQSNHRILIGSLDDLPDNPHGNGPQDKETKHIDGSYTTNPNIAHKTSKHKKKIRPKRDVYNLDIMGTQHAPYSNLLEENSQARASDYGKFAEGNYIQNGPTETPNELESLYKFSSHPKDVSQRNDVWASPHAYREQFEEPSQEVYNKFIENEASHRGEMPSIRARSFEGNERKETQRMPIDRTRFDTPGLYNVDSHITGFNNLRETYPEKTYPTHHHSFFQNPSLAADNQFDLQNPVIMQLLKQKADEESKHPYTFENNEESVENRAAVPTESYDKADRYRQIANLINKYDEQTKEINGLYRTLRERIEQNKRNVEERPYTPYAEHDQLNDPDAESVQARSDVHNEMPFYRDPVKEYQQEGQENRYEYERRDRFEKPDNYPQQSQEPYQENYQENPTERNDVPPNNDFMRSNVIPEFLKMFANQNKIPNADAENSFPKYNGLNNENNYGRLNQDQPFFPQGNPNPYPVEEQDRSFHNNAPMFPTSQSFGEQQPQPFMANENSNFMNQNQPTPQQAAFMTNMGTTPENTNYNEQPRDNIANEQGLVMLMVSTPPEETSGSMISDTKKEQVDHQELTHDGIKRTSSNITDDERDFSVNLKKAADFVLNQAVKEGNISLVQRTAIEGKLNNMLDKQYKNKTRGEIRAQTRAEIPHVLNGECVDVRNDCGQFQSGGVCPFMRTFMKGSCSKTCQGCPTQDGLSGITAAKLYDFILKKGASSSNMSAIQLLEEVKGVTKSPTQKIHPREVHFNIQKVPNDPVMYLSFENSSRDGTIIDLSGNKNTAMLEKGAVISQRVLGSCGKAAELNEGSISWIGSKFKRKPDSAISIGMWVKVKKSGIINWFANGKKGDKTFYAKTKGTAVPAKVWTHVAGTFDSDTGLARIYINGDLEQEQQQKKGAKLAKNWLVNGIGKNFGDDSLRYADEVILYDRALSRSEVRMLFNRCVFNRMILHFGFQKGNVTSINDQSGLENNGILIGGAAQKADCDRCGACLDLTEGPDPTMRIQQITVKYLPKIKVSIAVWVSLNSTRGVHNIFTTESSEGNIGYRLQVVNGKVRWAIGTDTIPVLFDNMTKNVVVPESLWTHVIATYNNENGLVKIYVNGLLKFKYTVSKNRREYLPTNWDNDASIGDRTIKGYIDEFILYNWELDDSEALYVRNYCADHPKLVRFTVRVPLTKKTFVPRATPSDKVRNWWELYRALSSKDILGTKKTKTQSNVISPRGVSAINPNDAFTLLKHKKK